LSTNRRRNSAAVIEPAMPPPDPELLMSATEPSIIAS
jgi:hypothetical protein